MIAVDDGAEPLSGQRPGRGQTQDIPTAAGLLVDNLFAIEAESQLAAVERRVKHTRRADILGVGDDLRPQRAGRAGGEEHDQIATAGGIVDHTRFFQHGIGICLLYTSDAADE